MLGRIVDGLLRMPPVAVRRPVVHKDISIPMPDGVTLLADRYSPPGSRPLPVVLVRTPYGRGGPLGDISIL